MNYQRLDTVVVIMAGGVGTRFWPVSTEKTPKQFLNLFDDRTLLQKSFDRVSNLVPPERILVLTNAAFVSIAKEQLPQIPVENIIGEPIRRNTAAAVGLAAVLCRIRFGNPVIVTLTADHLIEPVALFKRPCFQRLGGQLIIMPSTPSALSRPTRLQVMDTWNVACKLLTMTGLNTSNSCASRKSQPWKRPASMLSRADFTGTPACLCGPQMLY